MIPLPCTSFRDLLAIFILLLLSSGCADYSKLSAGRPDGSADSGIADPDSGEPAHVTDLAGVDFTGVDLTDVDFTLPPEIDGSSSPDMTQVASTDMAKPCVSTLANITGDFTIRFTINTTAFDNDGVLSQRSACNIPSEGMWDIRLVKVSGQLVIETAGNGASAYSSVTTPDAVNNGAPHDILISRSGSILSIYIDGTFSVAATATAAFGALPVLRNGYSPCEVATAGMATNVCLQH